MLFFAFLCQLSNFCSFFHCILSILYVLVSFLCGSLPFFVSSFIPLSLSVVLSLSYVTAVQLYFDRPLYFVNSLSLCLFSLSIFVFPRQLFDFSVFVSHSVSFLRHCLLLFLFSSFISSILYVFVCFLCHSLRSFVRFLVYLSLSFVLPLYFVNSPRLCLHSLSFFALFLSSLISLSSSVVLSLSYILVFRSLDVSFCFPKSFLYFRTSLVSVSHIVFRQFSPTLFAFFV